MSEGVEERLRPRQLQPQPSLPPPCAFDVGEAEPGVDRVVGPGVDLTEVPKPPSDADAADEP